MKISYKKMFVLISLVLVLPILSSCFTILYIDQPQSATFGETITVNLEVRTEDTDENPRNGILGLLIPEDWTVNSVEYSGDFGPDEMSFLHPDSMDANPGGAVEYWNAATEDNYPPPEGMQWVIYQGNTGYISEIDTGYVDVTIEMTVGNTPGTYDIGYLVTNAALDFTDSSFYSISLDNVIEVTGATAVANSQLNTVPTDYRLLQNYPNPFNPQTTIRFDLPVSGHTRVTVYDLSGTEVTTLLNGFSEAGSHSITFDAQTLPSGIYYYRIESRGFSAVRKMAFIK